LRALLLAFVIIDAAERGILRWMQGALALSGVFIDQASRVAAGASVARVEQLLDELRGLLVFE
jgi:hypothetical protein